MEEGPKYAVSKEGLIKLAVIFFGCVAWSLQADSGSYDLNNSRTWVFAAYIVSWSISVLFYFFHVSGLGRQMHCSGDCSFIGFDFIWSWLSTINFLAASITFAINYPNCKNHYNTKYCAEEISSVIFGFATTILYGVEAYFLKGYAPANLGYIATLRGWIKSAVIFCGGVTFGLLVDSNYKWCYNNSCDSGITYALVVYCLGWSVTVLIFLANIFLPSDKLHAKPFLTFQFGWSCLCVLLFLTASSCFAAFMNCSNFNTNTYICNRRLGGVIFGFATAILYGVDAFFNKPN